MSENLTLKIIKIHTSLEKKERANLTADFLSSLDNFLEPILKAINNSKKQLTSNEISDLEKKITKLEDIFNIFDSENFDKKSQILNRNNILKILNLRKKIEKAKRIILLLKIKIYYSKINSSKNIYKPNLNKLNHPQFFIKKIEQRSLQAGIWRASTNRKTQVFG